MFKTLEIKNFKSIGHATFDLGKINVLTGQSNLGKSNVVQAIYCLVHNHWDSNYLKWGTKKCSIRLTDANDEWVEYTHGSDSSAEYKLSTVEQPFMKIGRDVPAPVRDFLKMNTVQFDEDLSLDFNFERQFDPSFVISLSGFELAKVFGKLMNLDIVLSAARSINKDIAANKKSVDGQEAIENVSIEYIQKNYSIELKYALLHQAIKLDALAEELDKKASSLRTILLELEYTGSCLTVYEETLRELKQADTIKEPIPGLDNVITSLISAQNVRDAYKKELEKEIPLFDFDVHTGLSGAIFGILEAIQKRDILNGFIEKLSAVDYNLVQSISEKKDVLDHVVQWEIESDHESSLGKMKDREIEQKKKEFKDYLVANNVCPISGKPFVDGCVTGILESV